MKFVIVLLAAIGFAAAAPRQCESTLSSSLLSKKAFLKHFLSILYSNNKYLIVLCVAVQADNLRPALEQLLENVDVAKLLALIPQLAETQDGQELLAYLRGADFGRAIDAVKAEPVTDVLLGYLESNGLENVRQAIKDLGAALGIPSRPFALFHQASTKSLSDLIDELLSVIDVDGLLEDLLTLVASDPAVTNLLAFLSSDEVEAGYLRLKANSAILAVTARLRQEGVDVDAIIALIEGLLGYGRKNGK